MILGSHVSFSGDQLLDCTKKAIEYKANAFMFYSGAPQNTIRRSIDDNLTKEALKLMKENNINIENVICHAPYIVNPAAPADSTLHTFTVSFLKGELTRCDSMNIKYLVLHPGSAVKLSKEEALNNIVITLNEIFDTECDANICLETMAGKGTEIGNLDELEYILKNVKRKDKINICLDTCHLHDSGIDIALFDNYLDEFDSKIGINKIKCVHLNDSKNTISSHKDRHANIGFGNIGFDNLLNVLTNKRLANVPKILETPWVGDNPPYKLEIAMLKNKEFNPNLFDGL